MRPALRQVLKHPDANFTMPFGLVQMDNGELALLCSREKTDEKGRTVQAIIAFSKDGGATWSDMQFLFDAGRHHANLQRLPGGDLVCTLVVRDDIRDGQLASHRRGCDALVSHDHGRTWNLDRRFELDGFDFLRPDGYWVDGKCGHIAAAALADGHLISVYGHYQLGAAVLIKWKPDAEPVPAVPNVGVQIGPQAGELERYATMAEYVYRPLQQKVIQ